MRVTMLGRGPLWTSRIDVIGMNKLDVHETILARYIQDIESVPPRRVIMRSILILVKLAWK